MKKIIVNNYDKIVLLVSIFTLSIVFVLQLTSEKSVPDIAYSSEEAEYWARTSEGVILKSNTRNNLMPGDHIFYRINDTNFSKLKISKIFFKRRSEISILLKTGKLTSGTVKAKEGLTLSESWLNSSTPILLDVDGRTTPIQGRQVSKVIGSPQYVLEDSADLTFLKDKIPHFYQRLNQEDPVSFDKRPEWKEIPAESNNTIYELFTPPLIYLIDNKLTTTLPDAPVEEKEKEPFGVSILSFEEIPYRFRLASWIGNSPYIEDRKLTEEMGRSIRNRLEVNKSYMLAENPKPGRPTLLEVDTNSSEKLLTLKYFTVQNVTQKNGGIKPVGRALIEDHSMNIKPFEINSLMEEVFLNQFEVRLMFKIGKEDEKEVILREVDEGKEISYNGRKYSVLNFDSKRKSIKLRKQDILPHQFEDIELLSP